MTRPLQCVMLAAQLSLAGCSLEPAYETPASPMDTGWPDSVEAGCCDPRNAFDPDWRAFVSDSRLRRLIELALVDNRDLQQAAASVAQARAGYQGAAAALYPSLGVDTYAGRAKLPALEQTPGGGASAGSVANTFQATVGFTAYELDFFGRARSQAHAAEARFHATLADYQAARMALIGEVAGTWLTLKANQSLLGLAERTFESQQHYGQMLRSSFNLGSTARIDVHQADAITNTAAVQVSTYRMQVAQNLNALRVLVGQTVPAGLLPEGQLGAQMATADVPAGVPSSLLERRPDIRAAQAQLRAANAEIGSARAAYFPSFSLTGALGSLSGDFSRLLTSPAQFWNLAALGSLTLLDAGQRRAGVDATWAQYDQRVAAYEQTVLNAFREAANALNARQEMLPQVAAQRQLVEDYEQAYRQSRLRFEAGLDSYFSTMDAQRSLFGAQQRWLELELAREINQVNLFKALGGGWSPGPTAIVGSAAQVAR
ncbi:efflux transporter outer membrane subunit [Pseudomonas sp. p99-361]|uniref:efflux transporter outer membrane subunit n=1 Tax=Pseudomonas sp. p99-361 TaxID=2479852 RepID=UPI000F7B45D2|nr:efflux transporter outer membrane subunit [Pseudomonas sp. p99-361]RRV75408.1 efflux transporter outer membrane subunit [Pseudomonas sp. p99-361]